MKKRWKKIKIDKTYLLLTILTALFLVLLNLEYGFTNKIQGFFKESRKQEVVVSPTPTPTPLAIPTPPDNFKDALGLTTVSFLTTSEDTYIKINIELYHPILKFMNSESRSATAVFTEQTDESFSELIMVEDERIPDGSWTTLVQRPTYNESKADKMLISDHIFSFKKIPNTQNFLFVLTFERSSAPASARIWNTDSSERILYVYDGKLKKIQSFKFEKGSYSFPKITGFSPDERYVLIRLYGCWGCDGHTPEIYLLDLQTLQTKNIGKVSYFKWQDGGKYSYKDHIVTECEKGLPGVCNLDPDTLPLKEGIF